MLKAIIDFIADVKLVPEATYCVACLFIISFAVGFILLMLAIIMKCGETIEKKEGK